MRKGTNSESMRWENRKLIIRIIKREGVITRKDLALKAGLQAATITIIIKEFLERGIVEELGLVEGKQGRRLKGLRLSDSFCVIAVRISLNHIKIGVYELFGHTLFFEVLDHNYISFPEKLCDIVAEKINAIGDVIKGKEVLGIGVTISGPVQFKDNAYYFYDSNNNFFDLKYELEKRIHNDVIIGRPCNCSAYHLWMKKSDVNKSMVVAIYINHIVECGIIMNGKLLNGATGQVGNIGKMKLFCDASGEMRSVNDECTAMSIVARVAKLLIEYPDSILGSVDNITISDVIDAYYSHDKLAERVFNETAEKVGTVIAEVVHCYNPDLIYVGGIVPQTRDFLWKVYQSARGSLNEKEPLNLLKFTSNGSYEEIDLLHPENEIVENSYYNSEKDSIFMGIIEYVMDVKLCEREFLC